VNHISVVDVLQIRLLDAENVINVRAMQLKDFVSSILMGEIKHDK
jgi:hypothetical protein